MKKLKSIYKLISAIVVVVVLTAGVSVFLGSRTLGEREEKIVSLQKEIVGLQGKLSVKEMTISSLENKIDDKEMTISLLEDKIENSRGKLADKEMTISLLEDKIENTKKFWRLLLKGIEDHQLAALVSKRAGESDFDDFDSYFNEGCYEDAKRSADKIDVHYKQAMNEFMKTKGCFLAAKEYAPSERSIRLVEDYIKSCEYAIDLYSEMHKVGEYYSHACSYYAKGQWSQGVEALGEASNHIETYCDLIDSYLEWSSNIFSLLKI